MEKVVRDGHVAVLISRGYGAGWYSWHGVEELIFDPVVVDMLENNVNSYEIEKYCMNTYGEDPYYGGLDGLTIEWVPLGSDFIIDEYDGAESLMLKDKFKWITA
jgi:hypothetical protein